jgi:hypothetical protein
VRDEEQQHRPACNGNEYDEKEQHRSNQESHDRVSNTRTNANAASSIALITTPSIITMSFRPSAIETEKTMIIAHIAQAHNIASFFIIVSSLLLS